VLTNDDINFINANRAELTQGRTESIFLIKPVIIGTDPFTNEPIESEPEKIPVDVVWKEYSTVSNGDRSVIGGVELRQDDVKVTFNSSVDLSDINEVERSEAKFTLIAVDEKGIGGLNRYECVARRVT
jgi:hypothetical protein